MGKGPLCLVLIMAFYLCFPLAGILINGWFILVAIILMPVYAFSMFVTAVYFGLEDSKTDKS